ncbi:MAG TPA: type II toxin-antitoxin system VapC family toxin [Polyangiaceae bacterium]
MAALDTNVVVRLLVQDDEDQCRRAEVVFRRAVAAEGVWLAAVVLVEVSWVLRVAYRFDRASTAAALRRLTQSEGVVVESETAILRALAAFEKGPADFADYVILEAARGGDALPLQTFDERLAKADGVERVP